MDVQSLSENNERVGVSADRGWESYKVSETRIVEGY